MRNTNKLAHFFGRLIGTTLIGTITIYSIFEIYRSANRDSIEETLRIFYRTEQIPEDTQKIHQEETSSSAHFETENFSI